MRQMRYLVIPGCLVVIWWQYAGAYELRTHSDIAANAYDASVLASGYLDNLGISQREMLNVTAITDIERFHGNDGTAKGWFRGGSVREDDISLFGLVRVLRHFYNPLDGNGLNITGIPVPGSAPAPGWALGLEQREKNQFTIPDARNYLFNALTGEKKVDRERNFALTFRALGQVIHLIQDMAQPQHVRNDRHGGFPLSGEASVMERYIEARMTGAPFRSPQNEIIYPPLKIGDYPSITFNRYFDFWRTGDGRGIAEFTNRNFLSAGTNLGTFRCFTCGTFPEPPMDQRAYEREILDIQDPVITPPSIFPQGRRGHNGQLLQGSVTFFKRNVVDSLTGEVIPQVRLSTRSIFDQYLERRQLGQRFSLNTINYDEAATILLSRAVGYSAGLINYFFRGNFDVDMVPNEADPSKSDLKVTNRSPEAVGPGTINLYYDDSNDNRFKLEEWSISEPVLKDGELSLFTFIPQPGAKRYILVFKGKLGNEEGAVIGKVFGKKVGVEEVFYDWGLKKWLLRNALGLYVLDFDAFLPAGTRLTWVKWGDQDNSIIGITPSSWNVPNMFYIFRIKRPEGSIDVPITGAKAGELDVVDLELMGSISLGDLNLDTGTTINLNVVHHYRQYLPSYEPHSYFKWIKTGSRPEDGYYFLDRGEIKGEKVEVAYSSDPSYATSFRIILDPEHNLYFSRSMRPYYWWLWGFYLNRTGEVILLINVIPYVSLPDEFYRAAYYRHTSTGAIAPVDPPTYAYFSPGIPDMGMLVLVNLSRKALIGKTSQDRISLSLEGSSYSYGYRYGYGSTTYLDRHAFSHYTGGPDDGKTVDNGWSSASFYSPAPSGTIIDKVNYSAMEGTNALSLQGLYGQGLEGVFSPISLSTTQNSYQDVYAENPSTSGQYLAFNRTVSTTSQKGIYSLYMGTRGTQSSVQEDPAASDVFYLQFEGYEPGGGMDKLIDWDFSQKRGKLLLQEARPPGGYHAIRAGNSRWALWEGYGMGSSGSGKFSHLIDRQNGLIYTYPDRELFWEGFTLLQPDYLYNVRDTKFYTIGPTLTKTSEPEDLYPHPGNHIGWDFHVVGR